ncbi:MAG: tetratricopeptide repeat protein [Alphaproteobacteria bacterium]|nr:MAG: tetratricopeptide repeat protein [Alphaproteobacteria bacterium]
MLGALVLSSAAQARVERSPLQSYVEARAASSAGAFDRASQGYVAALAAAPENDMIATQALSHAVTAGDWRLALDAAHRLESRRVLPPDARLLLVAEAFRERDWTAAKSRIDAVQSDQLFAFMVPVLRAWLAYGSRQGDPLAALPAPGGQGVAAAYAAEHRPLLMLALNRPGATAELVRAAASAGARGQRLRIAGAALLAKRGEREAALALLEGNGAPIVAARALVGAGQPLPGAIDGADSAMAELLVRLSLDLQQQELTGLASMFARVATWLAPDNSETWMVTAELLALQDKERIAVPMLANVPAGDPFAIAARDQRIRILLDGGDREAALAEALAATGAGGAGATDWVRLGEVYAAMHRQNEAASAFARAIEIRRDGDGAEAEWVLWLMRGGALDEAGNWPEARTALRKAYALAPEQPFVLNYLGYAQLVRREDVAGAERLIREAHRRAPDSNAITDSLGWALYLKGELPEAITLLEQAAQGEPADVEINEHLGDAYFAAGRRVEARFAWMAASVYAEGDAATRIAAKIETGLTPQLAAR